MKEMQEIFLIVISIFYLASAPLCRPNAFYELFFCSSGKTTNNKIESNRIRIKFALFCTVFVLNSRKVNAKVLARMFNDKTQILFLNADHWYSWKNNSFFFKFANMKTYFYSSLFAVECF